MLFSFDNGFVIVESSRKEGVTDMAALLIKIHRHEKGNKSKRESARSSAALSQSSNDLKSFHGAQEELAKKDERKPA